MEKSEEDYLAELVAFPSVSTDLEASKKCADFCAVFFKKQGFYTELVESSGFPNVIATTKQTKTPKVLLQCHMDVVPAEPELFIMKKAGNKLLGRGTFDMKFACASYMKLVDELSGELSDLDFGIMLTFDEEIGGHDGVEMLLKKGYSADVCILPDSGKDWRLECSAHGAWFVRFSKKGKNAHASLPKTGINSAELLSDALSEIRALKHKYPEDDLTLSLTKLTSGKAINQIPDHAEAVFDIRFRNTDTQESLKANIDKICAKRGVDMQTIELAKCMNVDSKTPEVVGFIKIAEEVLGRKISTSHSAGSTDARYFCAYDIPCIVIQPDGGGRHSDDEWVDKKGIEQLTKILVKYVQNFSKTTR